MQKTVHPLYVVIVLAVVVLGAAVAFYFKSRDWYAQLGNPSVPVVIQKKPVQKPAVAGLGSELYAKSQNPVAGKLPDTAPAVPNPIQNVYKNPFE